MSENHPHVAKKPAKRGPATKRKQRVAAEKKRAEEER